jgi:hypothetical protein
VRLAAASVCLALGVGAGCPAVEALAPGAEASAEEAAAATLAARGLALPRCNGFDDGRFPSGLFVYSVRTSNAVSGSVDPPTEERIVLRGIAAYCIDGDTLTGSAIVCELARTRLPEPDGTCSSLVPSLALLAGLPAANLVGERAPNDPEGRVELVYDQPWGLEPGAPVPPEPSGESESAESPIDGAGPPPTGLVDADGDGDPGVTLHPNVSADRTVFAARSFEARMTLSGGDLGFAQGVANVRTQEVVLGGYASASFVGRVRADSTEADAHFVSVLDPNRDGVLTCLEGVRSFGELPPLLADACE